MIEMLDLYFQYVIWLNRTLVNGIKWLVDNDCWYYVTMCLVPVIATTITMVKDSAHSYQLNLTDRYQKIEQAQKADISKLLEIYSHEELKSMKERIEKEL